MKFEPVGQDRIVTFSTTYLPIVTAIVAGLLWYTLPKLTILPFVLGIIPWFFVSYKKQRLILTSFYGPLLLLFLLTAFLGIWLAYNRDAAWAKFWILTCAGLLFYALGNVPGRDLWPVVRCVGFTSALVAVYFLLSHNWHTVPAGIGIIDTIGRTWMRIRPSLGLSIIHPNIAGGIMVMLVPYLLAAGLYERRQHHVERLQLIFIAGFITSIGLLMTASRGAALALAIGLSVWLLWLVSERIEQAFQLPQHVVYGLSLTLPAVLLLAALLTIPGGLFSLFKLLPGVANVDSRVSLLQDTLKLIGDFPFTGAGLATFPGLHSHYILRIPNPFYYYSHNLYLDILLEQGPFGLLTFVALFVGCGYHLWLSSHQKVAKDRKRVRSINLLRWAVFTSLLIILLHGLVDDSLYSNRGSLLLLLTPGLALAVSMASTREGRLPSLYLGHGVGLLFSVVIIGLIAYQPIRSAWYANMAAVQMARFELANWPTGGWRDSRYMGSLTSTEALLENAVALNPVNESAHYRLGQIALLRRDFEAAVNHLEIAFQRDRTHQGIQKALGYSYVWTGEPDKALPLLLRLVESPREMEFYAQWWKQEGRDDLARRAAEMAERLYSADAMILDK
jgi:O-antigen ligase